MKNTIAFISLFVLGLSCTEPVQKNETKSALSITGTWKLLIGILIEKGDTVTTDYTKNREFIKIINDTHFAFLGHDLAKGKNADSTFSAGGGTYSLKDSSYTENLMYCNDRQWEGTSFHFTITINKDTLIQKGIEKIDSIGVNRLNIEKYVRINSQ